MSIKYYIENLDGENYVTIHSDSTVTDSIHVAQIIKLSTLLK